MNLTNEEKLFLRELSMNPHWGNILQKLDEHAVLPRYKKGSDETAVRDWIRASGYRDATDYALIMLGYRDE